MPNETQWFDQVGKHKIEIWVCDFFSIEVYNSPKFDGWLGMVRARKGYGSLVGPQKT